LPKGGSSLFGKEGIGEIKGGIPLFGKEGIGEISEE
jgi:hypothetical protein